MRGMDIEFNPMFFYYLLLAFPEDDPGYIAKLYIDPVKV
jgi:hypothetical protein